MNKYSLVAIGTILVIALFLTFSPTQVVDVDFDYIGMISDINKSSNGYTFTINTTEESIKCYFEERPNESMYKIMGDFSNDGNIFFISSMTEVE